VQYYATYVPNAPTAPTEVLDAVANQNSMYTKVPSIKWAKPQDTSGSLISKYNLAMLKGSVVGTFGNEDQHGTKSVDVTASNAPAWSAAPLDSNNAVISGYPNKLGLAIGKWWFKVRSVNALTFSAYSPTLSVDVYRGVTTTATFSTFEQSNNADGTLKGVKLAWSDITDQTAGGQSGKAITGYIIQYSGPDKDALDWKDIDTAKIGTLTNAKTDF
jgi:hypothetical protein